MKLRLVALSLLLLTGCTAIYRQSSKALDDLDGMNDVPDSIFDPALDYDPATDENPLPLWIKKI